MGVFCHFTVDIPKTLRCNFLWEELPTAPHLPNVFVHIKNGDENLKISYHGKSKILKNVVIVAFLSTYPHMFFPASFRSSCCQARPGAGPGAFQGGRSRAASSRCVGDDPLDGEKNWMVFMEKWLTLW